MEAFLADYEDRLGRWHHKGDMHERGLKLTALVRAYRRATEANEAYATGVEDSARSIRHEYLEAGQALADLLKDLPDAE